MIHLLDPLASQMDGRLGDLIVDCSVADHLEASSLVIIADTHVLLLEEVMEIGQLCFDLGCLKVHGVAFDGVEDQHASG